MNESNRSRIPLGIPVVLLVVAALVGLYAYLGAGPAPEVQIEAGARAIGRKTPVVVKAAEGSKGLAAIRVELIQGDRAEVLADKSYPHRSALAFWGPRTERDEIRLEVGRDTVRGLRTGDATIRVSAARVGSWLRHPDPVVRETTLPVRLTPPSLEVRSTQSYVAQGGCETIVYRVGDSAVRDGVRVGEWWFPGFPLPGGAKQDRFALFAVPYNVDAPNVRVVAADDAGNEAEMTFVEKFFPKPFRTDTIVVTDEFMNKVVPEIISQTPEFQDRGGLLQNYLAINGELRRKNSETLRELARRSRPEFLWSKPFLMMPNGKVMSAFADRRSYRYGEREIDRQDHLGFDLAVTRRAPIPASNSGRVAVAKYFGIFGNAVVIDHGYGLMSLYGHLASIAVREDQQVQRGDIIGATGETGLAGGDHLHFTMLLAGLPVNPVEWWDGHWIADRIVRKLGPAFRFEE
jgi:murein DD-endopeptidase MepM/ murein hydrolase activator NlpD